MFFFLSFLSLLLLVPFLYFFFYNKLDAYKNFFSIAIFLILFGFVYDITFWNYANQIIDKNMKEVTTESCSSSSYHDLLTNITSTNSSCVYSKTYQINDNEVAMTYYGVLSGGREIFTVLFILFIICSVIYIFALVFDFLKKEGKIPK